MQDSFPAPTGTRATVDVGGGSTEIIIESAGDMADIFSLPLGCVHLSERYLTTDPPTIGQLASLQSHIEHTLDAEALPASAGSLIGVGGTATTFVAMEQEMTTYDHARVHRATLPTASLDAILQRCIALPLIERKSLPGLHPRRADLIIAGGMVLNAVAARLGLRELAVSDRGLRWGVVLELLDEAGG